jgi:hypothetical protein
VNNNVETTNLREAELILPDTSLVYLLPDPEK